MRTGELSHLQHFQNLDTTSAAFVDFFVNFLFAFDDGGDHLLLQSTQRASMLLFWLKFAKRSILDSAAQHFGGSVRNGLCVEGVSSVLVVKNDGLVAQPSSKSLACISSLGINCNRSCGSQQAGVSAWTSSSTVRRTKQSRGAKRQEGVALMGVMAASASKVGVPPSFPSASFSIHPRFLNFRTERPLLVNSAPFCPRRFASPAWQSRFHHTT